MEEIIYKVLYSCDVVTGFSSSLQIITSSFLSMSLVGTHYFISSQTVPFYISYVSLLGDIKSYEKSEQWANKTKILFSQYQSLFTEIRRNNWLQRWGKENTNEFGSSYYARKKGGIQTILETCQKDTRTSLEILHLTSSGTIWILNPFFHFVFS